MIRVKDDHPDVSFHVTPVTVTDAEGHAEKATLRLESTDSSVVDVGTPAAAADGGLDGTAKFGAPGPATVNAIAEVNGVDHTVSSHNFDVTVGEPASFSGGDATFGDLVDDGT